MFQSSRRRLSPRDFVEMRNSRSTISTSRTSSMEDYTADYSLITNDSCVNTPRAKIFIVAVITCVLAVIIVIIVIVTRIETSSLQDATARNGCPNNANNCNRPSIPICSNYAVIGGGFAGSYMAYRLSKLNKSVSLYEATERIGGSINTQHFPNVSGVNIELGIPYFIPKLHSKMSQLVDDLGLISVPYYGPNYPQNIRYFTRGKWTTPESADILSHAYNLQENEAHHYPRDLFRERLQSAIPFDAPEEVNGTGRYSNEQSVRNALLGQVSTEGYWYIKDMSHQFDFQPEANAAQYLEYLNEKERFHISESDILTLKDGMSSLVDKLVAKISRSHMSMELKSNHTLESIEKNADNTLQLTFSKTSPQGPLPGDEVSACTKTAILAIPPKELDSVTWSPLDDIQNDLSAIEEIPSHMIYLLYDGKLLEEHVVNDTTMWIFTDLPLGEVAIFHAERKTGKIYEEAATTTIAATTVDNNNNTQTDFNVTDNYSNKTATTPMSNIQSVNNSQNTEQSRSIMAALSTSTISSIQKRNVDNTVLPTMEYANVQINQTSSSTKLSNVTNSNMAGVNSSDSSNMTTSTNDVFNTTTDMPPPIYITKPVTIIRCVFSAKEFHTYWKSLLERGTPFTKNFTTHPSGNKDFIWITDLALERINLHLSKVLNFSSVVAMPQPIEGYVTEVNNDRHTSAMAYRWKPRYDWETASQNIIQPDTNYNVAIVGQAYAPSYKSLALEGAIEMVDKLIGLLEQK